MISRPPGPRGPAPTARWLVTVRSAERCVRKLEEAAEPSAESGIGFVIVRPGESHRQTAARFERENPEAAASAKRTYAMNFGEAG